MTIPPIAVWLETSGLYYHIVLKQGDQRIIVQRCDSEADALESQAHWQDGLDRLRMLQP